MANKYSFQLGGKYKRKNVKVIVGLDPESKGGIWDTGLVPHDDAYFIFCNVGIAGRTGHDYGNYFSGDDLDWSGATSSHSQQPTIRAITEPGAEVHVFYRTDDHDPFTYAGAAHAVDVSDGRPVRVLWRFTAPHHSAGAEQKKHLEGGKKTVEVTVTERNPEARRKCLEHYGCVCAVCSFTFTDKYGSIGSGFMNVHHLNPVADLVGETAVDPVEDLRPICPNCHSMLHRRKPPYTVAEMKEIIGRTAVAKVT